MSRIRVKLDLSDFYDDKRRFAYVLIDPEWKNVKCLQRHVEKLFKLCSVEFVTVSHACFLPPREDIAVVNSEDILRVVAAESSDCVENVLEPADTEIIPRKRKKFKETQISNNLEPKIEAEDDKKIRKRKYPTENVQSTTFSSSVITDATLSVKKLKNIFIQKAGECDPSVSNSWKEHEVKDTTKESIASNCISDDGGIATKSKRKRKRKKKSKKTPEIVTENSFVNRVMKMKECFISTPILNTKPQDHIRFDDNGKAEVNDEEGNSEKTAIVFTSYLDNLCSSKARIIKGVVINRSPVQNGIQNHRENETVQEISLQNGIVLYNPEPTPSKNGEQQNEKREMEEQPIQISNGIPAVSKIQSETFSTKQILSLAEPLLCEPTIGDILIFKIYRLNECSEPSLSDFICGKFEDVESTKVMKIFLIDGQDQLVDSEGKTFMNLDMRGPDYLLLKYEDLIDKKVFRM